MTYLTLSQYSFCRFGERRSTIAEETFDPDKCYYDFVTLLEKDKTTAIKTRLFQYEQVKRFIPEERHKDVYWFRIDDASTARLYWMFNPPASVFKSLDKDGVRYYTKTLIDPKAKEGILL